MLAGQVVRVYTSIYRPAYVVWYYVTLRHVDARKKKRWHSEIRSSLSFVAYFIIGFVFFSPLSNDYVGLEKKPKQVTKRDGNAPCSLF